MACRARADDDDFAVHFAGLLQSGEGRVRGGVAGRVGRFREERRAVVCWSVERRCGKGEGDARAEGTSALAESVGKHFGDCILKFSWTRLISNSEVLYRDGNVQPCTPPRYAE